MDFSHSECALADCHILSKLPCSDCTIVNYCCEDHQKADWGNHKNVCSSSLTLKTSRVLGRHYVASRDLEAGTLIVSELPLLIEPTEPYDFVLDDPHGMDLKTRVCLGCCRPVADEDKCPKCDWPICSIECSMAKIHAENECPLFVKNSLKIKKIDYEAMIGVFMIRAMLIKKSQPQIWAKIQDMQTANSDMHIGKSWEKQMSNSKDEDFRIIKEVGCGLYCMDFLANFQKLERDLGEYFFETRELVKLFGIVLMNGFNYNINSDDDDKPLKNKTGARNLYLKSSMFSHACFPNCIWCISSGPEFKMEIRAAVDIAKGQILSIDYINADFVMGFRSSMQYDLKRRNFNCFCDRCVDPTELNSMISAVKCKTGDCQDGYLIPKDPKNLEPSSIWACMKCGDQSTETWEDIENLVKRAEKMTKKFQLFEPKKIENLLMILRKHLHPNHWVIVKFCHQRVMKELVAKMMSTDSTRNDVVEGLDYSIEIMKYLVKIFHLTMPGLNFFKADMQIELFMALDIKFSSMENIDKKIELGKEMGELFDEISKTKKFEPLRRTKDGQWKWKQNVLDLMARKEKLDSFMDKN